MTYHGVFIDNTESIVSLGIIRDMCDNRIAELSDYLTGGNRVNSPQFPSRIARSISPVAESSAQGAARAFRESAQEGLSRARWNEEFQTSLARSRAQQAAFEAAEIARVRNANMEDISSTSYKGKGKSTDK
ncbi:hypothetical protein GCM10023339_74340 [Alloalcanivorax gelatiniphagus]